EDVAAQPLEPCRVVLDREARERRQVEAAEVVVLAVPRERPRLLLLGERVGREVGADAEEVAAHGTTTALPVTSPAWRRRYPSSGRRRGRRRRRTGARAGAAARAGRPRRSGPASASAAAGRRSSRARRRR